MGNFKIWPAAPVRASLVAFILIVLSLAGACNGSDVNSSKSNSVNGSVIFDCNACSENQLAFSDAHVALKCQRGNHLSANATASVNADGSFIIHLDKVELGDVCSTEVVMPNNKLCSSAKTSVEKLSVSTPLMCKHAESAVDQRPNLKLSINLPKFHAAPEFSTLTNSIESKQSLHFELFKKKPLPELPPLPFIFKPKPFPKLKPLFKRPPIPLISKPKLFLKPKFFKPKPLLKPPLFLKPKPFLKPKFFKPKPLLKPLPFLKPKPLPKPKFLKPKPLPKLSPKPKFLKPKPIPKLPPKPKFFKPKPMPELPPKPKFFKPKPMPELPRKPKLFEPKPLPKLPPKLEFLKPKPMLELPPKPKFFKPKPLPKLWPKPKFFKPKPLPKLPTKTKFFQSPSP
eukprot:PITA_15545